MFNAIWIFVIFLVGINVNNLYVPTTKALTLIFIGLICFNLPFTVELFLKTNKGRHSKITSTDKNKHNKAKSIIFLLQIFVLIAMLPLLLRVISIVLTQGYEVVRYAYTNPKSEYSFLSFIEANIYIYYVIFPLLYATSLYTVFFWSIGAIRKKNIMLMIINTSVLTFISGERTHYFALLVFFLAAFFISRSMNKRKQNKRSRNIVLLVLIVLVAFVVVTVGRGISNQSIIRKLSDTVVLYFSGGVHIFSITISNPTNYGLDKLTYGLASFSGLASLITTFTYVIFGIPKTGPFNTSDIQLYISGNIQIGESTYMNAFPTMYYYFIRDFGYMGVIILPIIFSTFILYLYKLYGERHVLASIMYLYITFLIVMTVNWWEPQRTEFWSTTFYIIAISLLISKKGGYRA